MFIVSGTEYSYIDKLNLVTVEELPTENFLLKQRKNGEYYLNKMERFSIKHKIYGQTNNYADIIFNTFSLRKNSTGVLLAGTKGSGKSLLAKKLSLLGYANNIPTILITEPFDDVMFTEFIFSIKQPIVILFDEFEKIYKKDEQSSLLSLLDGAFDTKKLFIFTVNDKYKINEYMLNRPGRILYNIDYSGVDIDTIKEYCEFNLDNKTYTEKIITVANIITEFNFDMLSNLVEESNRYSKNPLELINILNIKPEYSIPATYNVNVYYGNHKIPLEYSEMDFNPFTKNTKAIYINWDELKNKNEELWNNFDDVDTDIVIGNFNYQKTQNNKYYYQHNDFTVILEKAASKKEVFIGY